MKANNENALSYNQVFSRDDYLGILRIALEVKSYRFARQVALNWLAIYSGDLEVQLMLCEALLGDGKFDQALEGLEKIVVLDPEFGEAYALQAEIYNHRDREKYIWASSIAQVLDCNMGMSVPLSDWYIGLQSARIALKKGLSEEAERLIYPIIGKNVEFALPAVTHLRIIQGRHDPESVFQLARLYHARWPECLQFILCMADSQIHAGDETQAINLLHQAIANDSSGQVPSRIWGENYRYHPLWPTHQEIGLEIPIPVDVAYKLGWNKLAAVATTGNTELVTGINPDIESGVAVTQNPDDQGQNKEQSSIVASGKIVEEVVLAAALANKGMDGVPEVEQKSLENIPQDSTTEVPHDLEANLHQVEQVFEQLANQLNRPRINRTDYRFPIYVVFSTHTGLVKQYGNQTASLIESEMKHLAETVQKRAGWGAMVFLPDEIDQTKQIGMKAIETVDPWQLKLSLADLDKSLAKKGAMIGTILIVGGPEIVPFHRLPNPTDDSDTEIISDNPYATLDSNYFVPEWPVGRLPGEASSDAGLILDQIRRLIKYHAQSSPNVGLFQRLMHILQNIKILNLGSIIRKVKSYASFGYSAAAWRRSSLAAFRPIGSGGSMIVSPPEFSGSFDLQRASNSSAAYYNLHGLQDAAEWYGQRDLTDSPNGPDYPVALSPKDLVKNGTSPKVVFSEACYGGLVDKKTESTAIALRFLSIGTMAMIGSTSIAYGSVNTPLIGADLLSYLFWRNQNEGMTVGEAFLQAKIDLAREMNKRQGFLDGEDQKTLLSFVLYGDPLLDGNDIHSHPKSAGRLKKHTDVSTSMEIDIPTGLPKGLTKEMIMEVKHLAESYLPGMDGSDVTIKSQHEMSSPEQKTSKEEKLPNPKYSAGRIVVTVSKKTMVAQRMHRHYARATLDPQGKIVKLAVSR